MNLFAKSIGRGLDVFLLLTVTGPCAAFAQTTAINPPTVRALVENDRVKAYQVTFEPGDALPSLNRPRRIVHYETAGTLQRIYPDGKTEDVVFNEGDTAWVEAGTFAVKNVSGAAVVVFVVEVK